jgi:hypothetical protein
MPSTHPDATAGPPASSQGYSHPALVVLWASTAVKNHPRERAYTMMTHILTGQRPR